MKKSLVIASSMLALSLATSPMVSFADEISTNSIETVPTSNTYTDTTAQQQTELPQQGQSADPLMHQFRQRLKDVRQQLQNEKKALRQQGQQAMRDFNQLIKEKMDMFKLNRSKEALLDLGRVYQESGDNSIKAFANGQPLQFDVPPMVKDGRTLVPIRAISEAMGASVKWDQATKTINVTKGSNTVVLVMGSQDAIVNGIVKHVDAPPFSLKGRTLVPLRFISEALGVSINWQQEGNIITVDNGSPVSTSTTGTVGTTTSDTSATSTTGTVGTTTSDTSATSTTGTVGTTTSDTSATSTTGTVGTTSSDTTATSTTGSVGTTTSDTAATSTTGTVGTTTIN